MSTRSALIDAILARSAQQARVLVGIAGPPGAGKSTVASSIHQDIASETHSVVVPMDGYHLDNAELDRLGLRHRKGAPDTFDADGFVHMITRIRHTTDRVPVPGFDRSADCVVPNMICVEPSHRIVLIEGNYLLLTEAPWLALAPLFDITVFLNPGMDLLEERLVQRWLDNGHTPAEARTRAMSNDIPNAHHVLKHSAEADWVVTEH